MLKPLLLLVTALFLTLPSLALENVSLQLQWKHQFEFAGFYMAQEKGFYKNVGLDVSFIEYDSHSKSTVDKVLDGEVDYGLNYASIITEYMQGKPLVFVANFFKQSPLVLLTKPNIKRPTDLKNKTIMGISNSIDTITLTTMLNKFNITLNDIKSVSASYDINAFIEGKVDAMTAFSTNEPYELRQKGIKFNIFDPTVYGAEYYDLNLFTSRDKVDKNPAQVRKFKAASIKGWKYALSHKKEAIEIIVKHYNSQHKSKKALLFEANKIEDLMLPIVHPIGSIDINRVKLIADSFIQAGFIQNKPYHFDDFLFEHPKTTPSKNKKKISLDLSQKEKEFLKSKKVLHMCFDPNWMPYESLQGGQHVGIVSDYMKHLSSLLGLPIVTQVSNSWDESLLFFKEGKCDIMSLVAKTKLRTSFMDFTDPYFSSPLVIATSNDKSFIADIRELKERKIGVVKNYATTEFLRKKYPDVAFVEVENVIQGLEEVANGTLFGFVDALTTISYQIQRRFPTTLKISGQLKENLDLSIGLHKEHPQFLAILNKAIYSIKDDTKKEIFNNWVKVKFEKSTSSKTIFLKILTPFLALGMILILLYIVQIQYNKRLRKQVAEKIEQSKEKDDILVQKQRMASMGEMLSMIAHQWRQPLAAINSTILGINIKIDSDKYNLDDPSEQQAFLAYLKDKHRHITDYVQHLSNTTDDFRNFFSPNKRKEIVPLTFPISDALKIVANSIEQKGIKIIQKFQVSPKFNMYKSEIMQVILNLLKNAEHNFMKKRTQNPQIVIETFIRKNKTIISISDNGGGIPKEVAKHIFEPYFTTKNEKNGSGLGLYMSKIIIEDHHNGILSMKNKDDGVCFEITLTVAPKYKPK